VARHPRRATKVEEVEAVKYSPQKLLGELDLQRDQEGRRQGFEPS